MDGLLAGSGSMIISNPTIYSQAALEENYLAQGVNCDRFAGDPTTPPYNMAFTTMGDNAPAGRLWIPTKGLLEAVATPTRCGVGYTAIRANGAGHVVVAYQAGWIGVASGYIQWQWIVARNLIAMREVTQEWSGGLAFAGAQVDLGTVDGNCMVLGGGILSDCGFASPVEFDVQPGDLITGHLKWLSGGVPAYFACDPMAFGSATAGHLWVAGMLGNEAMVMSGSGTHDV